MISPTKAAEPISAGRCLFNVEYFNATNMTPTHRRNGAAGVRIVSPSAGGGDEHYCPASDVYLYMDAKDAQAISAYFAAIARQLEGV